MTGESHPHDLLHEAADGRLAADARAALDRHLESCPDCRAELDALRWTRDQLTPLREAAAPAGFEALLQDAIAGAETAGAAGAGADAAAAVGPPGLAALLLVSIWWVLRPGGADVVAAAADDHRSYEAGRLELEVRSRDVAVIEAWFRQSRLGFETRVLDLGMMRYETVGGRVHDLAGRTSSLYTYRGPAGEALVCQMYEGRTDALPPGATELVRNGITFHVYERDGLTLVFWQEGDLVCILTGAGSPRAVIDLAVAKAMTA
jgi:anti-sigma factor RsiW